MHTYFFPCAHIWSNKREKLSKVNIIISGEFDRPGEKEINRPGMENGQCLVLTKTKKRKDKREKNFLFQFAGVICSPTLCTIFLWEKKRERKKKWERESAVHKKNNKGNCWVLASFFLWQQRNHILLWGFYRVVRGDFFFLCFLLKTSPHFDSTYSFFPFFKKKLLIFSMLHFWKGYFTYHSSQEKKTVMVWKFWLRPSKKNC